MNPFDDCDAVDAIGPLAERSEMYQKWLLNILQNNDCHRILDVACGTGMDSIFLLEQGLEVVSCDDAEAMLFHARAERERRGLHDWDIKRANWLSLVDDLPGFEEFDAVLCLGSSILHLIDSLPTLELYRKCLTNFKKFLKPGGLLLIDHRNIDAMLERGSVVNKIIYHKVNRLPDVTMKLKERDGIPLRVDIKYSIVVKDHETEKNKLKRLTIPIAPVPVNKFATLLKEMFGPTCTYTLYGDLLQQDTARTEDTAFFQHVVKYKN